MLILQLPRILRICTPVFACNVDILNTECCLISSCDGPLVASVVKSAAHPRELYGMHQADGERASTEQLGNTTED